jgi:acyl-CoA thioester hydrolase
VPSGSGPIGQPGSAAPIAAAAPARAECVESLAAVAQVAQLPAARAQPGFVWRVRVYYEDTDSGGVVYYANYLRFFERCRTEWMRALGFGQRELAQREHVLFVVAGAELQFLRSAVLDDELLIDACLAGRGASYVVFEQKAQRGSEVLCRARVKVACIAASTMKPTRLPAPLVAALSAASPPACAPNERANREK